MYECVQRAAAVQSGLTIKANYWYSPSQFKCSGEEDSVFAALVTLYKLVAKSIMLITM